MTKEQAQQIVDELCNESAYNVDMHRYCGEYSINICDKSMWQTSMYINAKIVEVCHKFGCGITIQTKGEGQDYMRIVLM